MSEVSKECRLCGSTAPHQTVAVREMYFGTRELFEYYSCAACVALQIVNVPEGEELARHYLPNYHADNVSGPPRLIRWLIAQHDHFKLHTGGRMVGALIAAPLLEDLGQFIGSEAYRRDIALTDPKILRMFGPKRIWEWERRAKQLNRQGRGDQTGFVLRAK